MKFFGNSEGGGSLAAVNCVISRKLFRHGGDGIFAGAPFFPSANPFVSFTVFDGAPRFFLLAGLKSLISPFYVPPHGAR